MNKTHKGLHLFGRIYKVHYMHSLSLSLTATPIFPFFELWKLNLKQLNYLAKVIYEPESALSHFIAHLFLNMSS